MFSSRHADSFNDRADNKSHKKPTPDVILCFRRPLLSKNTLLSGSFSLSDKIKSRVFTRAPNPICACVWVIFDSIFFLFYVFKRFFDEWLRHFPDRLGKSEGVEKQNNNQRLGQWLLGQVQVWCHCRIKILTWLATGLPGLRLAMKTHNVTQEVTSERKMFPQVNFKMHIARKLSLSKKVQENMNIYTAKCLV